MSEKNLDKNIETIRVRSRDIILRFIHQIPRTDNCKEPGINSGALLYALVLLQWGRVSHCRESVSKSVEYIEKSAQLFNQRTLNFSLYRGISGFGWLIQQYGDDAILPWRNKTLVDIDLALVEDLNSEVKHKMELINGLAGVMVYAITRGSSNNSSKDLWIKIEEVVGSFLSDWNLGLQDEFSCNLGVAHGIPGLLSMCSIAIGKGLLSSAMAKKVGISYDNLWAMRLQSDGANSAKFSYSTTSMTQARLAWCYGGLGLAEMFKNGICLDEVNVKRMRYLINDGIEQYLKGEHGINDASLCHGHAGVAVVFRRMAKYGEVNPEERRKLIAISIESYAAAFDSEVFYHNGKSTFLHDVKGSFFPSTSFLEGGAGIALAATLLWSNEDNYWLQLLSYY